MVLGDGLALLTQETFLYYPPTPRGEVGLEFCLFFGWISDMVKAVLKELLCFYILEAHGALS